MKIAYLISCYLDPIQLKKTIDSLQYKDLCDFYIHIDQKVDSIKFEEKFKDYKNVFFVKKRIHVSWGGYSQVKAILSMIELMLNSNKAYDRVVSMTGLDYPIFSNKKIQDCFSTKEEFMIGLNISDCSLKKQTRKYRRYWFFDHRTNNRKVTQILSKTCNVLFKVLPLRKKNYIKLSSKEKYKIYFSSDYWALSYQCLKDLYTTYINNKCFENYFKHCFAPSELFIATMLFNSKYGVNATILPIEKYTNLSSLTRLHYIYYEGSIKILNENDLNKIYESKKMFARKFQTGTSNKLIEIIDKNREKKYYEV